MTIINKNNKNKTFCLYIVVLSFVLFFLLSSHNLVLSHTNTPPLTEVRGGHPLDALDDSFFIKVDTNKDGKLSKKELYNHFHKLPSFPSRDDIDPSPTSSSMAKLQAKLLLKDFDRNGDGFISNDEMHKASIVNKLSDPILVSHEAANNRFGSSASSIPDSTVLKNNLMRDTFIQNGPSAAAATTTSNSNNNNNDVMNNIVEDNIDINDIRAITEHRMRINQHLYTRPLSSPTDEAEGEHLHSLQGEEEKEHNDPPQVLSQPLMHNADTTQSDAIAQRRALIRANLAARYHDTPHSFPRITEAVKRMEEDENEIHNSHNDNNSGEIINPPSTTRGRIGRRVFDPVIDLDALKAGSEKEMTKKSLTAKRIFVQVEQCQDITNPLCLYELLNDDETDVWFFCKGGEEDGDCYALSLKGASP